MFQYVLKTSWNQGQTHLEYATISLEEHSFGDKPIKDLADPSCSEEDRQRIFRLMEEIAARQSLHSMGFFRPMTIYRVLATPNEKSCSYGEEVTFYLKPIFHFNEKGKAVPVTS